MMAQPPARTNTPSSLDTTSNSVTKSKRKSAAGGTDGAEVSRKRVSQACDQCRGKKLKCDGQRPACTSCVTMGRQCLYGSVVKKRGLPEGYVRGLEKLLGLLISKDQQGERSVSRIFTEAVSSASAKTELMRLWNGGDEEDTLPEVWRNSGLSKALEQLLPDLEGTDGRAHDVKRPRLEPHSVDYGKDKTLTTESRPFGEQPLPGQGEAETLFEIFFTYTHCWLPIIGKDESFALYYRTLELSESSIESGEHAALWAIFAYAEARQTGKSPGCQQSVRGKAFYERARRLVPSEDANFKIGHVQALIILALLNLELGQLSTTWLLVGQAVNVAIDIGLGKSSTLDQLETPSGGSEKRKSVFFGCFCLDTLIAARLGRCPRLIKEDAMIVGPLNENGLAEWGHWKAENVRVQQKPGPSRSISTFNQLIRLLYVLNDSIRETYLGVAGDQAFDNAHHRLHIWKKQLPSHCAMKSDSEEKAALLPHQLNLHLMFTISMAVLTLRWDGTVGNFDSTTQKYPDHLQVPSQAVRQLKQYSSTFGSSVFPSTFYVLLGLTRELNEKNQGVPGQTEWKESLLRLSSEMNAIWPSDIFSTQNFSEEKLKDRQAQMVLDPALDPALMAMDNSRRSTYLGENPYQNKTMDDSEAWSTYSAAGDLFHFAQSSRASVASMLSGQDPSQIL